MFIYRERCMCVCERERQCCQTHGTRHAPVATSKYTMLRSKTHTHTYTRAHRLFTNNTKTSVVLHTIELESVCEVPSIVVVIRKQRQTKVDKAHLETIQRSCRVVHTRQLLLGVLDHHLWIG